MLDIKFIRENKDSVIAGARKKGSDFDVNELIKVDDERREILAKVEAQRTRQNEVSTKIPFSTEDEKIKLLEEMKTLKENLSKDEDLLKEVTQKWKMMMLYVPNIPDMTVPDGKDENDNVEIKQWGEKPNFDFEPKDHTELMTNLKMVDFDRGTKVHGFRGYFLTGDGAKLSMAIWNYASNFFSDLGFTPVIPPVIIRQETFLGTGYLPQGEDDLYKTQDGDFLTGTAEVPLMGFHQDEILEKKDLPKKYLGFSPCFRREAGSHSKDIKGLIRVHEFYKWEQLILCQASHAESVKYHEEINRNIESFVESLGIPYRTVINCGGDLGMGQVKKYDVELWVPKENKYREIGSASYFHDFQTRRLNIRYRDDDGKLRYAHSLNSTAIPTPRILVSLVENNQQADGSIKIPEVLVPYIGKEFIGKK